MNPKRWNIAPPDPAAPDLASRLKTSPLIAQALLNRHLSEPDDCQAFLRPTLNHLHRPEELAGLTRAAERIARAIGDREKIVIYGDYDVDGITATAILWHAIRTLGGTADYYIPHRIDEGYGLNTQAIQNLCAQGARLIISVDCGITALDPAAAATACGVDLIITDHHEWRSIPADERADDPGTAGIGSDRPELKEAERGHFSLPTPPLATCPTSPFLVPHLPKCYAIVHPRLPGGSVPYQNPALCGAGVAYKLAWGIGMAVCGGRKVSDAFRSFLIDATALAALGTIADVVPLVGENRTLAHFGLGGLKQSKLVGIRALIASAGLTGQDLDSFDVGFRLGPRLNASGRMGHARLAVEMLTSASAAKAAETASFLESQNRDRQATEKQILEQAIAQVTELKLDADGCCAIVLGHEQWHPGVIGIVASRIVERYHRPAIMVSLRDGHGQGSGRSINGFHLARALAACSDCLETHGGHEMAAGLKVRGDRFEEFRRRFCDYAASVITPGQLVPELQLDAIAQFPQFNEGLVRDLHRLGPFGPQNRRPVFCVRGVEVTLPARRVGRAGDHLQMQVRQGRNTLKCIAFNFGAMEPQLKPGTTVDLAVEPTVNEYNGRRDIQLEIKDIQFTPPGPR